MTNDMVIGDLIFIEGTGPVSMLISWVSGSKRTHVGVYFGHNLILEACAEGVVLSSLTKKYAEVPWESVSLDHLRVDRKKFLKGVLQEVGSGYDYLLLLGNFMSRMWERLKRLLYLSDIEHRWFCSELVVNKLMECGVVFPSGADADNTMSPGDLYDFLIKVKQNELARNI